MVILEKRHLFYIFGLKFNFLFHIEGDFEDTEEGEYCLDGAETAENGKKIFLFH
jgi:hypothetical protein